MQEIATSIFIAAKPDRIWRHLSAFHRYPAWNPFIVAMTGHRGVGEKIVATMRLVSADGTRAADREISARIVKVEDEHEIRWTHGSWLPGLMDFEHWVRIAPCKGGAKFHQHLRVEGLLTGMLKEDYFAMFRAGFEAMNAALKELVEAPATERSDPLPIANDNTGDAPIPPDKRRRASPSAF